MRRLGESLLLFGMWAALTALALHTTKEDAPTRFACPDGTAVVR